MAKDYRVILGAGVGWAPDYEGSNDYDVIPLATATVRYQFEREDPDSEAVDRLRDVNAAFEVGAFAGVSKDHFSGDIEVVQDVAGSHEGFLIKLGAGYGTQVGERLNLSLGISTTYASDDFMEAYFEIDSDNAARSGLPLFDAEGGFKDVGIGLFLRYSFGEKWGIFGLFNYTRLVGDAGNSPIVDDAGDPNQYFGGIGANYSF
jgi:outer membrane protein